MLDQRRKTFDLAITLDSKAAREILQKEEWNSHSFEDIRKILWVPDAKREESLKKLELEEGVIIPARIWEAIALGK